MEIDCHEIKYFLVTTYSDVCSRFGQLIGKVDKAIKKLSIMRAFKWRRIWDSNPGDTRMPDGFQDRSDQPLRQSSEKLLTYNIRKKIISKVLF